MPNLLHRCSFPTINPGERKTCLSPASAPFAQKVEFTSNSGQSFLRTRYWNAMLCASGVPSLSIFDVGIAAANVVWKSKLPHPLPTANVGETTALEAPFE